ncbi:MAG: double-strand break repair protein AddB [Pseudomonadota bacterium]
MAPTEQHEQPPTRTHRAERAPRANVLNVPPGVPFLPALADALLEGRLIQNWEMHSPLDLADVTIFLPTRRAARTLTDVLRQRIGGTVLLPSIRPLGDVQDDLALGAADDGLRPLELDPVMPAMERRLLLTELVLKWRRAQAAKEREDKGEAALSIPASPADAAGLAADLAALMDQVATEEVSWDGLAGLVPDTEEFSEWWDITTRFLSIAVTAWPSILAARDMTDPAEHRRAALEYQTQVYQAHPETAGPVVAAGSTGSIPATARLLRAISLLPQGALVLPGLDRHLEPSAWSRIGRLGAPLNEPGHPQYGLRTLLADDPNEANRSAVTSAATSLPVARATVKNDVLAEPTCALTAREQMVSELMRPANSTERWLAFNEVADDGIASPDHGLAVEGIGLLEAPDSNIEALAIAIALREVVDAPGQTAALVTPDRTLARRVRAALRRFDIEVDDSAGRGLFEFPQGSLLRLVLDWALGGDDDRRLVLAALLKHPMCNLGLTPEQARAHARTIEIVALRGNYEAPKPGELGAFVDEACLRETPHHAHPALKRALSEGNEDVLIGACAFAHALDVAVAPLRAAYDESTCAVHHWAAVTVQAMEALALTQAEAFGSLYADAAGEALASAMRGLTTSNGPAEGGALRVDGREWPRLISTLLEGTAVRPKRQHHPRLHILGPLEARLLHFDRVILGGMNEGTWPAQARNDPFLSRTMKAEFGLEPPERRIGQAAHDVSMLMGMPSVLLTRALRVDNAPTVASRWVQRMEAVVGAENFETVRQAGESYVHWATTFDNPSGPPQPCAPPAPTPSSSVRPKTFRFTDVERLIRDPYSLYARRVLHLAAFDPLVIEPSRADEGTILHDVFAGWVKGGGDPASPNALGKLRALAHAHFDELRLGPDMRAFWEPRFERIAEAFLGWQPSYDAALARSLTELDGSINIDADHTLYGRADRVDVTRDGLIRVLDYKGASPRITQVRDLSAPQLALEGAVARLGGFGTIEAAQLENIHIVRLKPGDEFKEEKLASSRNGLDPNEVAQQAFEQLQQLVARFARNDTPMMSRRRSPLSAYVGEYDHLARIGEWGAGLEDGWEGGG